MRKFLNKQEAPGIKVSIAAPLPTPTPTPAPTLGTNSKPGVGATNHAPNPDPYSLTPTPEGHSDQLIPTRATKTGLRKVLSKLLLPET